jgi:hypothetical protein
VALSAAASADPGGSVASRLWEIVGGDGPGEPCDSATLTSASAVSTTLQGASGVGFCHVRLTVTDNGGATDSDTVRVRFVSATLTPSAASGTVPFSPTFVFDIEHGAAPLDFGVFQLGLDTGGAIVASSQTSAGEVCGSGHRCYTYSGFTYATPDADLDPFVEYVVEGQVVLSATTAITANAPSAPVIQQVSVTPPSGVDPFDPLIGVVSAGGTGTLTVLADCDNSGGACPTSGSGAFETTLGTGTSVSSAACPAFTTAGANTFRVCVRDSAGTPQVTTASAQLVVEPQTLFGALSLDVADCPAPCDGRDVSILLSGTCPGIGAGAGVSVVGNCDNGGGSSDFSVAGSTANPIQFADACGGYTTGGKTVSATLSCGTANDFDAIAQLAVDAPFSISPVLFPTSCQPPCSVVVGAACGGAPEPVDNVTVDCEDDGTFESSGSALLDDCTEDPSAPPLATCFYSSTGTKTVAICGDTDSHDCGTATVTVNPAPASPILAVSPTSLAHTIVTGENAPADTLLITNQGGGTLAWTITETPAAAWVSASPLTGTTTTETDSVPVSYATTGLPDGVYTTTLRVVNDAAPSSPVLVPVTITVNNPENEIATCGTGIPTWSDHASIGSFSGGETKITYTSVNNGAQIVIHLAGDQTGNCFHYANGDVGCVAPVTINRMTPDHSGTCEGAARGTSGCLNGWMRNPNHDGNYALDSRMTASASHGWAASQLGVGGDPDLPVTISAPATILKAFSYPTSQTTDTGWDGTKTLCTATQPCAKYLAVFSVVAVRPALPAGTFRPPIYGTTKPPSRTVAAIDWGKLGRISISGNGLSMTNAPSFTAVRKRFLEAQVDISDHFDQRMMHATGNFDWAGYHGGLSADASAAISRFTLSDFDPTNRTHCEAVVGMLQWGLDLWWQHERGWAFNDHSHGRQFVYAFAANLLKDPSMKAKFESVAGFGAEEIDRYYFGQGAGKHLWGHTCTPIQFWQRHWNKSLTPKDCGDPHGGYVDGHDEYWECCNFQQDALAIIAFEHLGIRDFYDSAGLMEGWFEANYRRYTSGVEKRPDPCAPYDGVQGNYGVTFGPPGGSATPGCEVTRTCACITGSHPPDRDINGLADGARVNSGIAQPGDHWPAWRSAYKAIWACARAGTCVLTP